MPGWRRVLTVLLIVLGPGAIIYFLATHLKNKFVELPYLGEWTYEYDSDSTTIVDSTAFVIPDFTLTKFDGTEINKDSLKDKFIVLSTIQPDCPELDNCGMSLYLFDEIFYQKLEKNQDNYGNVKVLSILTTLEGEAIDTPSVRIKEEMAVFDSDIWWCASGDPMPLFSWDYYGKNFMEHESTPDAGEVGPFAFTNALVLLDREGHVRGVTGAKRDSDIRNFFDLLKILKKEEFDQNWEAEHPEG